MKITFSSSNAEVMKETGRRIKSERIAKSMTQGDQQSGRWKRCKFFYTDRGAQGAGQGAGTGCPAPGTDHQAKPDRGIG